MSSRRSGAWQRLMDARGLSSYRRIAEKAEISHEAVRRVILGMSSDDESVEAVARAFGIDVELVREMRSEPAVDAGRWNPPPGARLLTDDERAALSRLIGVMVAGREREDGGNGADSAAASDRARGSRAPKTTRSAHVASREPDPAPDRARKM